MTGRAGLFGKISIIDVLVLAVVIVMAVALYVKTNHREITSTTTSDTPFTYQILVSGVRGYVADAIREKDSCMTWTTAAAVPWEKSLTFR